MLNVKTCAAAAGILAASVLSISSAQASAVSPVGRFYLNATVDNSEYDVTNIVEWTDGPSATTTGQFAIGAGGPSSINNPFVFPGPASAYNVVLIGIAGAGGADANHTGGLVLFTNTGFVGSGSFNDSFPGYDEASLVSQLQILNPTGPDVQNLVDFGFSILSTLGFHPGDGFIMTAYSDAEIVGSGTSAAVAATPIPAALPLFASGLGVIGLFARRRKQKAAALAA
jgi:hypothetical protein